MVPVNGHGGDASDLGMPTVASSFIRTDVAWGPGTGAPQPFRGAAEGGSSALSLAGKPLRSSDQARGRDGEAGAEQSGGECATRDGELLSGEQAGSLGGLAEAKD